MTGASKGIGRAVALALAGAGADVACAATSRENAQRTAAEISATGRRAIALGARVEKGSEVTAMFNEVAASLGPLDILVNNAGVSAPKSVLEMTEADWDRTLEINAKGVFLCAQAAARQMVARGAEGVIVNIGSIAGQNAFPNRLAYGASKAAAHHMTKVMAIEWAGRGIRVNCIAPGFTRTEMVAERVAKGALDLAAIKRRTPLGRLAEGQDIADAVVYLAGAASPFVTGALLTVDGGFLAYGYL